MFLTVQNNGAQSFSAKYDGVPYTFEPNQKTTISGEAARHIFGVGLADKTEVLTRHGWLNHSSEVANAMSKLDSFAFSIPNDNPDDEPIVELAQLGAPAIEDEKEQESALLHLGAGTDADFHDDYSEEVPANKSSLLDSIPTFTGK